MQSNLLQKEDLLLLLLNSFLNRISTNKIQLLVDIVKPNSYRSFDTPLLYLKLLNNIKFRAVMRVGCSGNTGLKIHDLLLVILIPFDDEVDGVIEVTSNSSVYFNGSLMSSLNFFILITK